MMTTYQSPRCFNKLTYTMLCGLIIASYMIMFASADKWTIRLERADNQNTWINLLGIDVYDSMGIFISSTATPTMSAVYNNDNTHYGPQWLIDGLHKATNSNGARMTRTTEDPNAWVQLDLSTTSSVYISYIVVWNRMDAFGDKIIGCQLIVFRNYDTYFQSHILSNIQTSFSFPVTPPPLSFTPIPFRDSSTSGPIRSVLGRCMDVQGSNFKNGQPVIVYDCHCDGYNEQWFRPNASDLRLQIYNNLCIDVFGGALNTAGALVVVSTCDPKSYSQQWVFDGRRLHLRYNAGLCLKVKTSGQVANYDNLIVSYCDNSDANAWVEYSLSSKIWITSKGLAQSGYQYRHFLCPVGETVVSIRGTGTERVDQILMICSGGNILGPVGSTNSTGNDNDSISSSNCTGGYSTVQITSDITLKTFVAYCTDTSIPSVSIGNTTLNNATDSTQTIYLVGNQQIIGMEVYYLSNVGSVALLYTHQLIATLQPSPPPNERPSAMPSKMRTAPPRVPSTAQPTSSPTPKQTTWVTMQSPLYGTITPNITEKYSICPPNSMIVGISGMAASLIYQIIAICDDVDQTIIGPFGVSQGYSVTIPSCWRGYDAWNITFGSYIGQIKFSCSDASDALNRDLGAGLELGSGSNANMKLLKNQRIVGFHVYYDLSGIHSIAMIYAYLPHVDPSQNPQADGFVSFLLGFVTLTAILLGVFVLYTYIERRRGRRIYQRHDQILPLK